MRFRTFIDVPDDATYGSVVELRDTLNAFGSVSDVVQGENQRRHVEFVWEIEPDESQRVEPKAWVMQAIGVTTKYNSTEPRLAIIRYLEIATAWNDIVVEVEQLGFYPSTPEMIDEVTGV